MPYRNTTTNYGSVTRFFHWLSFILITLLLIVGLSMQYIPSSPLKGFIYNLHKLTGLLLLTVVFFWSIWSATSVKPAFPEEMPWLQRFAARFVHFLLYVLLFAMPFSGWVMSTASGKPPHLFSLSLPLWDIPFDKELSHQFANIHEFLAWCIIVIASMHIIAALSHHFINRDFILRRMLPNFIKTKNQRID